MTSMSTATNVDKSGKDLRVTWICPSAGVPNVHEEENILQIVQDKAHNSVGDPVLPLSTR